MTPKPQATKAETSGTPRNQKAVPAEGAPDKRNGSRRPAEHARRPGPPSAGAAGDREAAPRDGRASPWLRGYDPVPVRCPVAPAQGNSVPAGLRSAPSGSRWRFHMTVGVTSSVSCESEAGGQHKGGRDTGPRAVLWGSARGRPSEAVRTTGTGRWRHTPRSAGPARATPRASGCPFPGPPLSFCPTCWVSCSFPSSPSISQRD